MVCLHLMPKPVYPAIILDLFLREAPNSIVTKRKFFQNLVKKKEYTIIFLILMGHKKKTLVTFSHGFIQKFHLKHFKCYIISVKNLVVNQFLTNMIIFESQEFIHQGHFKYLCCKTCLY